MSALNKFDDALDDATHGVVEAFGEFALPEGVEFVALLYRINDALTAIMRDVVNTD